MKRVQRLAVLLAQFAFAGMILAKADAADTPKLDGPLTIAKQGSFFVGGHDIKSDALSTVPLFGATGTITVDQVSRLTSWSFRRSAFTAIPTC